MTIAIVVLAVALLAIFTMQNMAPVSVSFFSIEFYIPLAFVVILTLLLGLTLGIAYSRLEAYRTARQHKKELKEAEVLQNKTEYERTLLQQRLDEMTQKEQERIRLENEANNASNDPAPQDNTQQ